MDLGLFFTFISIIYWVGIFKGLYNDFKQLDQIFNIDRQD